MNPGAKARSGCAQVEWQAWVTVEMAPGLMSPLIQLKIPPKKLSTGAE